MLTIDLDAGEAEVVQRKGEECLIGKVCVDRAISKIVITSTMARVWRLSKSATFMEVGPNLFIIAFSTHADKQKTEEGQPWLFDNSLFIFHEFDGESQPNKMVFDHEAF